MRRVGIQPDTHLKTKLRERLGDEQSLSEDKFRELLNRAKNGDEAARNELVEHNMGLVAHLAKKYTNRGVSKNDLIQEGVFGLINAIKTFDLSFNTKFSTHAGYPIEGAMKSAIANQARLVRIPADKVNQLSNLDRLINEKGELSLEEIAQKLETDIEGVKLLLELRERRTSSIYSNKDTSEKDLNYERILEDKNIPDIGESIDQRKEENIVFNTIDELVEDKIITPRDREVIFLRNGVLHDGIGSKEEHTLEEVGKKFGITRERVRQIEAATMKKVRAALGVES